MDTHCLDHSEETLSYEQALSDIGEVVPNVLVIDVGLATSMQTGCFAGRFPTRYFNLGIAEQNAVGVASGLARRGFIPIVHSFSNFLARRAHDQIAVSVAWPNVNVKLIGGSCGLYDARNGASHTATDDLSVMAGLPNLTVVEPGDQNQTTKLLNWIVGMAGPAYLRLRRHGNARNLVASFSPNEGTHWIRRSMGATVTLLACGSMLQEAIGAADLLLRSDISVDLIHITRLKPLSAEAIVESAHSTKHAVTIENHGPTGGFGDAIGRLLGPDGIRHTRLGLPEEFLPPGDCKWHLERARLNARQIAIAVEQLTKGRSYVSV